MPREEELRELYRQMPIDKFFEVAWHQNPEDYTPEALKIIREILKERINELGKYISDYIDEELLEKLSNTNFEKGFHKDVLGRTVGYFLKYRGFEIGYKERVMYSRNPIKAIIQEILTLFKIKECPHTEFFYEINKVPDRVFKHLLM